MDRLALIGVSHRRGGAEALETWKAHLGEKALPELLKLGFREAAVISTCNRFDVVLSLPPNLSIDGAKRKLCPPDSSHGYAFIGEGCVEQLARIAASLDSLNPGEDQIMMQVRDAFSAAQEAKTAKTDLSFAFSSAFRIAKKIRREVTLAPMHTSLFSLARPELEEVLPANATVGIIGVGKIGQLAARVMAERGNTHLFLINRRLERAQELADQLGGNVEAMALASFFESPPALDALISATSVPNLLHRAHLESLSGVRLIVDMGVPRNVEPGAAQELQIQLLDVDTLQEAGQRRRNDIEEQLIQAEDLLLEELDEIVSEWIERQLGSSIHALRQHAIKLIVDVLPEKEAGRLATQLTRGSIKGLRALARESGLDAARTFLDAAGFEALDP